VVDKVSFSSLETRHALGPYILVVKLNFLDLINLECIMYLLIRLNSKLYIYKL
jgi:hypothetical protein